MRKQMPQLEKEKIKDAWLVGVSSLQLNTFKRMTVNDKLILLLEMNYL